jgi:amino acid adenylation domain-containing protein
MRISGLPGSFSPPVDAGQSTAERFERCARLHADRTAVVSETWPATYLELDQASNRLARSLLAHPGAAGDRVAVIARHDAPLLAAVLGVLKAGRCAVILNPTDPDARLVQTLRHAEATQIVADAGNLPLARRVAVPATGAVERIILVDDCLHGEPTASPGVVVDPEAMAFLVYTSGSTGTPKGVIRSHRNMVHNTGRLARCFRIEPADRLAMLVSLGTGNGISLALAALLTGAAVCPFPVMDRGIAGLPRWMRAAGVTIYSSSSSLFRSLMRVVPEGESFPGIRLVRLSSEPAQIADVSAHRGRFSSGCRFIHTLASSETGTIASCELTDAELAESGRIPVGEAVSEDVEIRLLDAEGREVPPGEIGEVTVRSRYLASGYWRAPELTAEKFTFVDGVATFRSGDCARLNARGQLEFTGRRDARLKIRGFRIEPSEVEAAIRRQGDLDDLPLRDGAPRTGKRAGLGARHRREQQQGDQGKETRAGRHGVLGRLGRAMREGWARPWRPALNRFTPRRKAAPAG